MKRMTLIVLLALAGSAATASWAPAAPEKAAGGIRFTYTDPNAGTVAWAGEFNGWSTSASPMTKDAKGVWSIVVALPAGEHQYKLVVDGQWVADPENPATAGDMGNSVVRVGVDGNLGAAQATANTPYSAKILMGGRMIGQFQDVHNPVTRRFELRRPELDTDLGFDIRVSDVFKARVLTNINSEKQAAQDYRTSLTFDRGSLGYAKGKLQVGGWFNETAAVGTWDDPMHLVGAVGIYQHPYGFDREGFQVASQYLGFDAQMIYADNFQVGGTTYPSFTTQELVDFSVATVESLHVRPSGDGYSLVAGQLAGAFRTDPSDQNADMFALRVRRPVGHGLRLGLLGRSQRGSDLGATVFTTATGPLSFRQYVGTFDQSWYAFGGELAWDGPAGVRAYGELLHGMKRLSFVPGFLNSRIDAVLADLDTTGAAEAPLRSLDLTTADGTGLDLDRSDRWLVGGTWTESHGDILVRAELEHQTHAYEVLQDGISNSMTVARLDWDRNWRYYLAREVKTSLGVEYTRFDYDPRTPWGYQLWFPDGNFWLERTEHVVSVDRMVMLGGNDALRIRPTVEVPVLARRNGLVRWKGTFETEALDRRPKYAETRLQLGADLGRSLRLGTDSRWVKYDDPFLGLDSGYLSHFADLTWTFAPGASLALGFGVDPWVIDEVLNEYADIGRDVFLFARGASGATAHDNYYGLGPKIAAAEKALENERVIQLKAIVHF
jgi:hypothetical protein